MNRLEELEKEIIAVAGEVINPRSTKATRKAQNRMCDTDKRRFRELVTEYRSILWHMRREEGEGMGMKNLEVRKRIAARRLRYFEVAAALNIDPCTLSRWLQTEMNPEKKRKVMQAIESIK